MSLRLCLKIKMKLIDCVALDRLEFISVGQGGLEPSVTPLPLPQVLRAQTLHSWHCLVFPISVLK